MDETEHSTSCESIVVTSQKPFIDKKEIKNIFTTQRQIQKLAGKNPKLLGKRYMGKTKGYLWRNNEPLITIGPHFPLFAGTFITFVLLSLFIGLYGAIDKFWRAITFSALFVQAFSYLYCALANPGMASAIDPDSEMIEEFSSYPNFCKKCKIVRDHKTIHCVDCDICIEGYDHHCPWTGKCIGEKNLNGFYMFFFTTCALILACFATLIAAVWQTAES